MSITHPIGLSRTVNRAILTMTLTFSGLAFITFVVLGIVLKNHNGIGVSLIYSLCLMACSLCSYLYTKYEDAPLRWLMRHCDHAAIFLLIAGTYTPFAATGIIGPFGYSLLGWIWGLAGIGITMRLLIRKGYDRLFIGLYVLMGWLIIASFNDVMRHVALAPVILLGIGGAVYTIGAIIFARDIGHWTDAVWHGCVLTAACIHFAAVVTFLVIAPAA